MMSNNMLTNHAAIRMAQRGFTNHDIDIIQQIGIAVDGGYFMREKECREAERNLKKLLYRLRKLEGARLVMANNQVITAYHAAKTKTQRLLRNTEDREFVLALVGGKRGC